MTQIEIWDAPGAPDYESCWPAIMKDTAGVAIVYDPEKEEHVSESGAWYDFFVKNNNLSDDQCIVFAFTAQRENTKKRKPSPKLEHLNIVNISSEDPRVLSQHFDRFLRTIKSTSTSKDHK